MKLLRRAQWAWIGQAGLIVLPVVVLSGVALHFLREDRTAMEQDARNRANAVAPDAARQIGEEISTFLAASLKNGVSIQGEIVDGRGGPCLTTRAFRHLPTGWQRCPREASCGRPRRMPYFNIRMPSRGQSTHGTQPTG